MTIWLVHFREKRFNKDCGVRVNESLNEEEKQGIQPSTEDGTETKANISAHSHTTNPQTWH